MAILMCIVLLFLIFTLIPVYGEYVTPTGPNTCEGYISEHATHIVSEKVLMKEKYHDNCLSFKELFRCTKYRDVYETKHKKVKGPITKPAIVCCDGYKQIETKCIFDQEKRNNHIVNYIIITSMVLSIALLCLAFTVPTFLYLREKRRRIHLEDLEHDPDIFVRPNSRPNPNNRQQTNIYSLASPNAEEGESHYETIDELRGKPPAYESCSVNENSQRACYTRNEPPPYSEQQVVFNEHGYDQLKFVNMAQADKSYGAKNNRSSRKEDPHKYAKMQQRYKSFESHTDKNDQPGSSNQ